jgi:FG-GAP repeat
MRSNARRARLTLAAVGGAAVLSLPLGPAPSASGALLLSTSPFPTPTEPEAHFGESVALSGDGTTALVGAPLDRGTGTARFYEHSSGLWVESGPPFVGGEEPADCESATAGESEACRFGFSVALSDDGGVALIGVPGANHDKGAAWVFTRSGSTWNRGPELRGAGAIGASHFGRSVSLSSDGDTALITGPWDDHESGSVWVFTRSGDTWTQQGPKLLSGEAASSEQFGRSAALSGDGATALIGAPGHGESRGAAWVFSLRDGAWERRELPLSADEPAEGEAFGHSVALSGDGTTALIGAPGHETNEGAVWAFTEAGGAWGREGTLRSAAATGGSRLGTSIAVSASGDLALAGGPGDGHGAGAAWEFVRSGSSWTELGETLVDAPGDEDRAHFGASVTLSASGGIGLVGGPFHDLQAGGVWNLPETTSESPADETAGGETVPVPPPHRFDVLASRTEVLPLPVLDRSGDIEPVAGRVLVKLPGSNSFTALTGLSLVPFGTTIDATRGRVTVTTVGPGVHPQRITFYGGIFKLVSRGRGRVVAVLTGGDFAICPTARERSHRAHLATAGRRAHVVRKLWASGHGSYATQGAYAAGAVQGTLWLTEDRCDGTLIYVATDRVAVTNLVTGRHRRVRAHHRYFAAAP